MIEDPNCDRLYLSYRNRGADTADLFKILPLAPYDEQLTVKRAETSRRFAQLYLLFTTY